MPLREGNTRTGPIRVRTELTPVGYVLHLTVAWSGLSLPAERLAELEDVLHAVRVELEGVGALARR